MKTVEEPRASNGNIIALACGPLKKPRYINPKIEQELVDFKKEIEEKFNKSPLQQFVMPKLSQTSIIRENESGENSEMSMRHQVVQGGGRDRVQNRLIALSTD